MDADPSLSIRVEPADGATALALQQAFFEDIVARYPSFDPALAPSADPQEVTAPRGLWLVAYLGGGAVACGGLKGLSDGVTGEIKRVFVAPDARGGGIARALMAAFEEGARRLGFERLRLDVGDRQPEALGLYLDLGFYEIEDYNGNPFASHWMEKAL
jgi:GNAT superfamily N-acetyltransferase